jgi:hypothetical protein
MDSPDSGFLLIIGGLLEWGLAEGTAADEGFDGSLWNLYDFL